MKKIVSALYFLLMLSLLLSPLCFAAGDNYDTLADWNIRVAVPDGTTAVLQGNEYYIYAQHEGSIPYVMLRTYGYDDEQMFITDFTEYMRGHYPDLKVIADAAQKTFGGKSCFEIDYSYKVSGYDVKDRRVVKVVDGLTYMFASKEIEANGMTLGTMLDDVVANCEFLSAPGTEAESGLSDGYLFCLKNGMPKYWLDLSGAMSGSPVLHCYFRSSDPTFYESCFILDLSTAEITDNGLEIHTVRDEYDFDHSNWFNTLTFQFYLDGTVMSVDRDERTLAGGGEDNILTGTYVMLPVGVHVDPVTRRTSLRPQSDGPYSPEELADWAQIHYFCTSGFFPPEADVTSNPNGTFTIHLYEIVDLDGLKHTATSAWYTVDAYGVGRNDITEEPVSLF